MMTSAKISEEKRAIYDQITTLENLAQIRSFIGKNAVEFGVVEGIVDDFILAVDEAVTNILVHGYKRSAGPVKIEIVHKNKLLQVYVQDQAAPFDPTKAPSPDLTSPLERRPFGGLGVYFIRKAVDRLIYRPLPVGGNELLMEKDL